MKCPACGTLNAADAVFCKGCGTKFRVSQCPECSAAVDPDALFCSSCGSELAPEKAAKNKTCQSCGFVNTVGTIYCKRCNQRII